ncbi:Apolipoprotein N-acyltransferase [Pseudooceanicola marinus]|uniref:Apolipoprotein N-acyltransferase n=1 Tax=Pseudooceanicola marinus TaxID=396013 RepID=A0A1X6ZZ09_9RHOB|nr:apolipoprotein N-acyltransferase [Pseudooceanicola marinus]SLN65182.1 Apolipoprotein N-acyltransferase [Pseudooceanicola marinus]
MTTRLSRLSPRRLAPLWPVAAGALAATGQAPLSLWPAAIMGFALLTLAVLRAERPARAARAGWLFGAGYFALALAWIVEPFMVDIARHGWMAPFALVLMAGGLALFWGGAAALAKRVAPAGLPAALALAATLTLAEALRGWIFTGFPWALIGHALIPSPLLPLAAWGGPHALSLLLLLPATLLGAALSRPGRSRVAPALLALVGFAAPLALAISLPPRALPAAPEASVLRLVQPNAPQREKWLPDRIPVFFNRLQQMTAEEGPEGRRPDLVIWPETAVPYLLNEGAALTDLLAESAQGSALAFGVQRRDGADYYNSLALLGANGEISGTYDKHHLVPFGEYLPLADLMADMGIGALASRFGGGYTPGPGARLMELPGIGRALPLICYEAVFPRDIRAAPARPDLLLQVTNDAWFGSFSGPYQHLAQARLRAVEQGLPLVRAANTGVSALISADGELLASLPLNTTGHLDVTLPPPSAPTPYSRHGDWSALLVAFALFCVAAAGFVHHVFRSSPES